MTSQNTPKFQFNQQVAGMYGSEHVILTVLHSWNDKHEGWMYICGYEDWQGSYQCTRLESELSDLTPGDDDPEQDPFTPNPNRDDLPAAFQKAWFDYPLSTDDPLGFDHYEQLVDEINTAETESVKRLRALLPKPVAGDVIHAMGMKMEVYRYLSDTEAECVIIDYGENKFYQNTKFIAIEVA